MISFINEGAKQANTKDWPSEAPNVRETWLTTYSDIGLIQRRVRESLQRQKSNLSNQYVVAEETDIPQEVPPPFLFNEEAPSTEEARLAKRPRSPSKRLAEGGSTPGKEKDAEKDHAPDKESTPTAAKRPKSPTKRMPQGEGGKDKDRVPEEDRAPGSQPGSAAKEGTSNEAGNPSTANSRGKDPPEEDEGDPNKTMQNAQAPSEEQQRDGEIELVEEEEEEVHDEADPVQAEAVYEVGNTTTPNQAATTAEEDPAVLPADPPAQDPQSGEEPMVNHPPKYLHLDYDHQHEWAVHQNLMDRRNLDRLEEIANRGEETLSAFATFTSRGDEALKNLKQCTKDIQQEGKKTLAQMRKAAQKTDEHNAALAQSRAQIAETATQLKGATAQIVAFANSLGSMKTNLEQLNKVGEAASAIETTMQQMKQVQSMIEKEVTSVETVEQVRLRVPEQGKNKGTLAINHFMSSSCHCRHLTTAGRPSARNKTSSSAEWKRTRQLEVPAPRCQGGQGRAQKAAIRQRGEECSSSPNQTRPGQFKWPPRGPKSREDQSTHTELTLRSCRLHGGQSWQGSPKRLKPRQ